MSRIHPSSPPPPPPSLPPLSRSGIAESPLNWLDSYFAWVGIEGGCCGYYNTTTPSNPVLCDTPGVCVCVCVGGGGEGCVGGY